MKIDLGYVNIYLTELSEMDPRYINVIIYDIVITMAKEKPERCSKCSNGCFTISANAKIKNLIR